MAVIIALNFRATLAYVTDPASTVFLGGEGGAGAGANYPTSKNSGNGAVNVGYLGSDLVGNLRDRQNTAGREKLAGTQWASGGWPISFQVDLPSAGTYRIRLALGDPAGGAIAVSSKIYDGTTAGTLKATILSNTVASGEFVDATGVIRGSLTDWYSSNAYLELTFATSTFTITLERDLAAICHLSIESVDVVHEKTGTGSLGFTASGTQTVPKFGVGQAALGFSAAGVGNMIFGETGTGRMGASGSGAKGGITHTKQNSRAYIKLAWDASPDPSVDNYTLYWNLNSPGPPYPFTSGSLGNITTYLLSNLDRGAYEFVVTCSNPAGESPVSNEVAATLSYGMVLSEYGPKVHEFLRQEIGRLGMTASGLKEFTPQASKFGGGAMGFSASGADVIEYAEAGLGVMGFTASGPDAITYVESARVATEFVGSGVAVTTGAGLFLKEGTGQIGFTASGELASVFGEAGTGYLGMTATGTKTVISIPTTVGHAKKRKRSEGRSRILSLSEDR